MFGIRPNADISHLILDPACPRVQENIVWPLEGSASDRGEAFSTSLSSWPGGWKREPSWGYRLWSGGYYLCVVELPFHLIRWALVSCLRKMGHHVLGTQTKGHPPKTISAHFALSPNEDKDLQKSSQNMMSQEHHEDARRICHWFFTLEQIFLSFFVSLCVFLLPSIFNY